MRAYRLLGVGVLIGGLIGFAVGHWGFSRNQNVAARTTTTAIQITTTTVPPPSVEITPTSGPIGTSFTLAAHGFLPGGSVHFAISFPNGRVFTGQPHPVGADGSVSTTYAATSGNPAGAYQVTATDNQGSTAKASFVVGPTSSLTTAPRATTTTR